MQPLTVSQLRKPPRTLSTEGKQIRKCREGRMRRTSHSSSHSSLACSRQAPALTLKPPVEELTLRQPSVRPQRLSDIQDNSRNSCQLQGLMQTPNVAGLGNFGLINALQYALNVKHINGCLVCAGQLISYNLGACRVVWVGGPQQLKVQAGSISHKPDLACPQASLGLHQPMSHHQVSSPPGFHPVGLWLLRQSERRTERAQERFGNLWRADSWTAGPSHQGHHMPCQRLRTGSSRSRP